MAATGPLIYSPFSGVPQRATMHQELMLSEAK